MAFDSILDEAKRLVHGERQQDYGDPEYNFRVEADILDPIVKHCIAKEGRILASHVSLMMIGLKIAREICNHKQDNAIDIAGYAEVLDILYHGT